jgi:hypothetical protein
MKFKKNRTNGSRFSGYNIVALLVAVILPTFFSIDNGSVIISSALSIPTKSLQQHHHRKPSHFLENISRGGGGVKGGGGNDSPKRQVKRPLWLHSSTSSSSSSNNDTVMKALDQNVETRLSAAKTAAIGALVDIVLELKSIITDGNTSSVSWLSNLTILYKLSLAYNIWQSALLYKKLPGVADRTHLVDGIVRVMRMTTVVWRQTAIIVCMNIVRQVLAAYEKKFPMVKQILIGLVGTVTAVTLYVSTKEIRSLQLPESPDREKETAGQCVARHGKVSIRAMSLCCSAFLIETMLIPVMALTMGSWFGGFLELSGVSSRFALATFLWNLRSSFASALKQMTAEDNTNLLLSDKASIQLYEAQSRFFDKAERLLKVEMVVKIISSLISLLVTLLKK